MRGLLGFWYYHFNFNVTSGDFTITGFECIYPLYFTFTDPLKFSERISSSSGQSAVNCKNRPAACVFPFVYKVRSSFGRLDHKHLEWEFGTFDWIPRKLDCSSHVLIGRDLQHVHGRRQRRAVVRHQGQRWRRHGRSLLGRVRHGHLHEWRCAYISGLLL